MKKLYKNLLSYGLGAIMLSNSGTSFANNLFDDLDQHEIVAAMGAGWNLGNTLEANVNGTPNETCWGNPMTSPALMKLIKSSGFNSIRIPVSYLNKIGPAPDYKIDEAWMNRVKEVVDMALAEDLYVITNIHGDGYNSVTGGWFLCNGANQDEIKAKYKAVWTQIATVFKDYDEHLIFESMNEEFDGTYEWANPGQEYPNRTYYANLNSYNQLFVETVRPISLNNAKRWLLIPGWNTDIDYTSEEKGFKIPNDAYLDRSVLGNRLMISVHYYAPWDLCGDDTDENVTRWGDAAWSSNKCTTYGQGANSENQMAGQFDKLKNRFTSQGYPVIIGEYGTVDKSAFDTENPKYTAYWTKTLCENSRRVGAVPVLWDNGHVSTAKGFATVNRATNTICRPYIIEAINEAFEQEIEIDTTAPTTKLELINSYIINITVDGAKEDFSFKCQYSGWSEVEKKVSATAKNLDIDLSPNGTKEGFTNLGYIVYENDSLYSVKINKIAINGYEFSSPVVAKALEAAQYQNALPNIWSENDGEYLSDCGKAILSITPNAISLNIKTQEETSINSTPSTIPYIFAGDGSITIDNAEGAKIEIITLSGSSVTRQTATSSTAEISLPQGFYIVKTDNYITKVIVK